MVISQYHFLLLLTYDFMFQMIWNSISHYFDSYFLLTYDLLTGQSLGEFLVSSFLLLSYLLPISPFYSLKPWPDLSQIFSKHFCLAQLGDFGEFLATTWRVSVQSLLDMFLILIYKWFGPKWIFWWKNLNKCILYCCIVYMDQCWNYT